jgi:hypothetical protein
MAKQFEEYISLAQQMKKDSQNRQTIFTAMENIYSIKPQGLPQDDHIKATGDPSPRNSVISGARMLSATSPKFSIPYAGAEAQAETDGAEKLAARIWQGAGMVNRKPIEFTMALSAMLYGRST